MILAKAQANGSRAVVLHLIMFKTQTTTRVYQNSSSRDLAQNVIKFLDRSFPELTSVPKGLQENPLLKLRRLADQDSTMNGIVTER